MKHYFDFKKQFSRIFLGFLAISIFFVFIIPIASTNAQSVSDIQTKITQRNTDIANLEQQINQYQSQLDNLGKQKSSLAGSIAELDITRKKLNADISVTQNKIDKTNLTIEGLNSQIGTKESSISNAIDAISLNIKKTNEFEQTSLVETILSDNNFTTAWNDIDSMATVEETLRQSIPQLQKVKGQLEDTRTATIAAKKELTILQSQLSDQKKIVDQNTTAKNKLLTDTKNSETNYQKLLQDSLAKKNAFEKEVQDYESQIKYILNPSLLPKGGVLSWPLDNIFITNLFGKNPNLRIYANGWHNGVDFGTPVGTPVKAMADGVVAGTGDTDAECPRVSFGRFVLIKYNNGLASTFGHLSLIKAQTGDTVARGDIVGYSGNTGYSTGPHLHVSVYARDAVDLKTVPANACPGRILTQPISPINAYLDPLYYLPPTIPSMFKSTLSRPD